MTALALPTWRDEAWRYSDLEAVKSVWPLAAPTRVTVASGETVHRHLVQDADDSATTIHDYVIDIADGAACHFHVLNIGGALGRVTLDVTLGEGAHFELGGAIIGGGHQTLEIVTTLHHALPNATSQQTIRSILAGHSTGSYLGKIAVARGAQKTDAAQSVKAMLLDRTATANAKPELEIYADDVKCAHGASIGQLDEKALFYFETRGIDKATAEAMLSFGFINEIVKTLPLQGISEALTTRLVAYFRDVKQLGDLWQA